MTARWTDVEFFDSSGQSVGFGLFCPPNLILTLDHVAAAAGGNRLSVHIPGLSERTTATAVFRLAARQDASGAFHDDVCVLSLNGAGPDAVYPPLVALDIIARRRASAEPITTQVNARIRAGDALNRIVVDGEVSGDGATVRFRPLTPGDTPLQGTSGSPVTDDQGRIIGVYHWVEGAADGLVGYIAPIKQILETLDARAPKDANLRSFPTSIAPNFFDSHGEFARQFKNRRDDQAKANGNAAGALDLRLRSISSADAVEAWATPDEAAPTYGSDAIRPEDWCREAATDARVSLLLAPGGSGKSNMLVALADASAFSYTPPIFLDVSKAVSKNSWATDILRAHARHSSAERLNAFVDMLSAPSQAFKKALEKQHRMLVLIDGLNEAPFIASGLARTAREIAADHKNVRFMLATRQLDEKKTAELRDDVEAYLSMVPLPRSQIIPQIEKHELATPAPSLVALFQLPLLLFMGISQMRDLALSNEASSAPEIIDGFIRFALSKNDRSQKRPEQIIGAISDHAWDMYREHRARIFPLAPLEAAFRNAFRDPANGGPEPKSVTEAWENFRAWLIVDIEGQNGSAQYRHQLIHDYLVARRLANKKAEWNDLGFDAATWRGQSPEALEMAATLVAPQEVPTFLRRVYDWHYPLLITCIHKHDLRRGAAAQNTAIPDGLRDQIAALLSLKLADKFKATRTGATESLAKLGGAFAARATALRSERDDDEKFLSALVDDAARYFENAEDAVRWRSIFTFAANVDVPDLLSDRDPLIGWTAANVARRVKARIDFADLNARLNALVGVTAATLDDTASETIPTRRRFMLAIRVNLRRIIYALGESNHAATPDALMRAISVLRKLERSLEGGFFQFAIEDALRSLLEIMAASASERRRIAGWLHTQILEFERPLLLRIARSSDILPRYIDGEVSWAAAAEELRSAAASRLEGVAK